MNNPEQDRLQSAFDAARKAAQGMPTSEQQARARAQFLSEAGTQSVSMNGDMRHRDQTGVLSASTSESREGERRMKRFFTTRRTRLIAAVLLGLILAGGFWASPSLRALAQTVIDFFTRTDDSQPSSVFVGGVPPEEWENPYSLTMEELIAKTAFNMRLPTFIPQGYRFAGARSMGGGYGVEMIFHCLDPYSVIITEIPTTDPFTPMEVGESAVIEDVPIRDVIGQYVRGTWRMEVDHEALPTPGAEAQEVPATRVWTNEENWHRLFWYEDGISFMVSTGGGIFGSDTLSPCDLTKADFVAMAQGLEPRFPLNE
jgi:hypothetical protein